MPWSLLAQALAADQSYGRPTALTAEGSSEPASSETGPWSYGGRIQLSAEPRPWRKIWGGALPDLASDLTGAGAKEGDGIVRGRWDGRGHTAPFKAEASKDLSIAQATPAGVVRQPGWEAGLGGKGHPRGLPCGSGSEDRPECSGAGWSLGHTRVLIYVYICIYEVIYVIYIYYDYILFMFIVHK